MHFAERFVHTFGSIPRVAEVCKMSGFECSPMPRFSANKCNAHHARQLRVELRHAATRDTSRNFAQHLLAHAETKHKTNKQRKRRIHITLEHEQFGLLGLLGLLATKKFKLQSRSRQQRGKYQRCSGRATKAWRARRTSGETRSQRKRRCHAEMTNHSTSRTSMQLSSNALAGR